MILSFSEEKMEAFSTHVFFLAYHFPFLSIFPTFSPWFFSQCLLLWGRCLRRNAAMCYSKNLSMCVRRVSGGAADTALRPLGDGSGAIALACCTPSAMVDPSSLWLQWPVAHSWIMHLTTAGSSNCCLLEITTFSNLPLRSSCLSDNSVLQHWPPPTVMLGIRFPWLCASALAFPFLPLENSILHVLREEYQQILQNWASSS